MTSNTTPNAYVVAPFVTTVPAILLHVFFKRAFITYSTDTTHTLRVNDRTHGPIEGNSEAFHDVNYIHLVNLAIVYCSIHANDHALVPWPIPEWEKGEHCFLERTKEELSITAENNPGCPCALEAACRVILGGMYSRHNEKETLG